MTDFDEFANDRNRSTTSHDLSLDPARANVIGTIVAVALLLLVVVPHWLLHDEKALKALFQATGWIGFFAALIGGIVVHELIHAVTWMVAGRLQPGDVAFGVQWKYLMPYAHPRKPMAARAYAIGAAAPGLLLGVVPALAGLVRGNGALAGFGAIFLATAGGDLLVIWSLRGLPAATLVQDHPTRVGCSVVEESAEAATRTS